MQNDILFKGMTRPAMMFGVPITPFVVTMGVISLFSFWTNLYFILLNIPTYILLRQIAKKDDHIFNLFYLKFKTTKGTKKSMKFWGATTFAPTSYRKIGKKEQRLDIHGLPLHEQPDFSKFIPYSSHVASNIILTKEGGFCRNVGMPRHSV